MRLAILSLVLTVAMVCAQEPAAPPAPAATPVVPPNPANAEGTISGSATGTGTAKPEMSRDALRPSKNSLPTASAYPMQYLLYVAEAMKSFQARDFAGALSYADRADALMPPTVWTLNVRGAVAIEQLKFDEGLKYCQEALRVDPAFFPAQFNLSEIPFLQKKYPEARKGWLELYNKTSPDDPTTELLVYRIFMTYLLDGDREGAKTWLGKIPFPSQTPAYQYANAAWERDAGNMVKWKEWIESAEFIWPLSKRAAFEDVLHQLSWLQKGGFSQ